MLKPAIAAALVAAFSLGACQWYGAAKEIAYDKAADLGNSYCQTRDPALQDDLKSLRRGLRAPAPFLRLGDPAAGTSQPG